MHVLVQLNVAAGVDVVLSCKGEKGRSPMDEPRTITRRKFLQGASAAAVGGLIVGAGAGIGGGSAIFGGSETKTTGGGSSGSTKPVKVGSTLPLTGGMAAEGNEHQKASAMCIEEWNARGGVLGRQIKQIVMDAQDMAPELMQSNFTSLIDKEHVDAIVNAYLLYTGPEYNIVADANTLYLHTNTVSSHVTQYMSDPQKYYMIFQADPPEVWYSKGFVTFNELLVASGKFKPRTKKIAILNASFPYSKTIGQICRDGMEAAGWTCSLFETFDTPMTDFGALLSKIRSDPPDWVFFSDPIIPDMAAFNKQFAENPTPSLLYGQYAPGTLGYVDLVGEKVANGVVWATVLGVRPASVCPQTDAFMKAYEARWGEKSSSSAGGIMYDTMQIYLSAVALAGSTETRKVAKALEQLSYVGTCGTYKFNSEHWVEPYPDKTKDPAAGVSHFFAQIQNGVSKVISPEPYVESDFYLPAWF